MIDNNKLTEAIIVEQRKGQRVLMWIFLLLGMVLALFGLFAEFSGQDASFKFFFAAVFLILAYMVKLSINQIDRILKYAAVKKIEGEN